MTALDLSKILGKLPKRGKDFRVVVNVPDSRLCIDSRFYIKQDQISVDYSAQLVVIDIEEG